jgi:hypothetical protein
MQVKVKAEAEVKKNQKTKKQKTKELKTERLKN